MPLEVQFRAYNNKQVRDDLRAMARRGEDMRPVLQAFADQVVDANRAQYDSQKGWRRLAPETLARKARQGLDPRILHATLTLRNSLTSKGGAGHIRQITEDQAFIGTSVFYARFHKKSRPPIKLRPADRKETVGMVADYIHRKPGISAFGGAGFNI